MVYCQAFFMCLMSMTSRNAKEVPHICMEKLPEVSSELLFLAIRHTIYNWEKSLFIHVTSIVGLFSKLNQSTKIYCV